MTASNNVSILDLLDLPDSQREILLWLTRHGPADPSSLIQSTGFDAEIAQQALDVLIEKGYIEGAADGRLEAIPGTVRSRKTLPADLWHALMTTDRHYSEQEIVTLRTAVPYPAACPRTAGLVWRPWPGSRPAGQILRLPVLDSTRIAALELLAGNQVVKAKVEQECDRAHTLIMACLEGGAAKAVALDALKAERAVLKHKTMALTDILAVFRTA